MPLSIVATAGAADANSYCTLAEARAYYATNFYATDANLSVDAALSQALVTATRLFDELVEWAGWVKTETQALLVPRSGLVGKNGYFLSDTAVPTELKNATAEFGRQILVTDRTADSDLEVQGITRIQAGSVSLDFAAGLASTKVVPDAVFSMIAHLGRLKSQRGSASVVRV